MTNIGLFFAVIGSCAAFALSSPACSPCPRNYKPVCGSDGVTYSNKCALECGQVSNKQLTVDYYGACRVGDPEPVCTGVCTAIYSPVCGSDGKTYGNTCTFDCARAKNRQLKKKQDGECPSTEVTPAPQPSCACTRELRPLCGNDFKTYNNLCLLNCAKRQNKRLEVRSEGECPSEETPQDGDVCVCPFNYLPVCGSDGKTYGNQCALNCAAKKDRKIVKVNDGQCNSNVPPPPPVPEQCVCNLIYLPVCGSDGKTYSNECSLNCAAKKDRKIVKVNDGQCKSPEGPKACVCTLEFKQVCGTNGVTYDNLCLLKCDEKKVPGLKVKNEGACGSKEDCACTRELAPVCASNGITYNNKCLLRCAAKKNSAIKQTSEGSCDDVNAVGEDQVQVVDAVDDDQVQVVDDAGDEVQVVENAKD